MMARIRLATLALLLATAPALALQPARVVDGDTIRVDGERVRIMRIDAPELHAHCPAELRLALASAARLRELVAGGVDLELHGHDKYRRVLAVVRDGAGRDLGAVLVAEGLARPYSGHTRREGWCG